MSEKIRPYIESVVVPKDTLVEDKDASFTYEERHRVFRDKKGGIYVEIHRDILTQMFVSEFLSELGILTCKVLKYRHGKQNLYLSYLPPEQNFSYAPSGAVTGWAGILFATGMFGDSDRKIEDGFTDTKFREREEKNVAIVLGNVLMYDFSEVPALDKKVVVDFVKDDIDEKLEQMRWAFDSKRIKEFASFKYFSELVFNYMFNKTSEVREKLESEGPKIVQRIMKRVGMRKVEDAFVNFSQTDRPVDLFKVLLERVKIMQFYFHLKQR